MEIHEGLELAAFFLRGSIGDLVNVLVQSSQIIFKVWDPGISSMGHLEEPNPGRQPQFPSTNVAPVASGD